MFRPAYTSCSHKVGRRPYFMLVARWYVREQLHMLQTLHMQALAVASRICDGRH